MKKIFSSLIGFSFFGLNYVNAEFFPNKVDPWIAWTQDPADVAVQTLITRGIWFLYLVAVVYALWGWFMILTAGWAEEKVKKWRTVITQALIGLVVIWLANSIVSFVVNSIIWGWSWA